MKKIIISVFALSMMVGAYGQETTTTKPERIKLVKGGESAPNTTKKSVKPIQTPEQELESCKTQLDALNKKEAYLKSNPEELKIAEEAGWFTDAAITRAKLEKRITELNTQLKK